MWIQVSRARGYGLLAGVLVMVTTALHGSDDKLKADGIAPRYPYYTYEDELPREPLEQPGASVGIHPGSCGDR